jgi:hypothetical protein
MLCQYAFGFNLSCAKLILLNLLMDFKEIPITQTFRLLIDTPKKKTKDGVGYIDNDSPLFLKSTIDSIEYTK